MLRDAQAAPGQPLPAPPPPLPPSRRGAAGSPRRVPPAAPPRRPSDRKKAKAIAKKGSKASLKGMGGSSANLADENGAVNGLAAAVEEFELNDRSTTGILTSHPQSRDIQFESFSLLYHGHELLQDTKVELNYGR